MLFVRADGTLSELRSAAIDLHSGEVGTATQWRFDSRFVSLITRCEQHLGGLTDIFPAPARRPTHARRQVPRGEARLTFHEDGED